MSAKRTTSILFTLRLLRMFVSILSAMVTAKYFGVKIEKDYWLLALAMTTSLVGAVWGPVNETFRTKFVYIQESEGVEKALQQTASLIGFIIRVSLVLCVVLFCSVDAITMIVLINSTPNSLSVFALLFICLLPSILFNEINNILICVLNAFETYYLPEIVATFTASVGLVFVYLTASYIGIFSLLVYNYIGIIALFLTLFVFLQKRHIRVFHCVFSYKWSEAKVFILYSIPLFLPYFISQSNSFFEKYLAGMLGAGMISLVDYARQFTVILQTVLSSVITTVMLPMLSKAFITKNQPSILQIITENTSMMFLILGLALCFLVGAAEPLCFFLYDKGAIDTDSLHRIAQLTRCYGMAFIGVVFYIISSISMLALNQRKQYAFIGAISQVVILAINFLLIGVFDVFIFPLSYGIVHIFAGGVLFYIMKIDNKKIVIYRLFRCVLSVILLSLIVLGVNQYIGIHKPVYSLLFTSLFVIMLSPLVMISVGLNIRPIIKKIMDRVL